MKWIEAQEAFRDAKTTLEIADDYSTSMARVLLGRLRNVRSGAILKQLKKELSQYNASIGKWKEQK